MLPTSPHMSTQSQSHFHSKALHFTAGDWRGEKNPNKTKNSCTTVLQKWTLPKLIRIQPSLEFCCFSEWTQLYLPCQGVRRMGFKERSIGNCSESFYFPKAFAGCRKMGEQGRRERKTCQQRVMRGNKGNTHSYPQTTANYSRTALLPLFHSTAFVPSLLERTTIHCLTTKVKALFFMFFRSKDKQQ